MAHLRKHKTANFYQLMSSSRKTDPAKLAENIGVLLKLGEIKERVRGEMVYLEIKQ